MNIKKRKTAWCIQITLAVWNVIMFYKANWSSSHRIEGNVSPMILLIIPLFCIFGAAIEAALLIISHRRITTAKTALKPLPYGLLQTLCTILAVLYLILAICSRNYYDAGFVAGCWGFMEIFLWMLR